MKAIETAEYTERVERHLRAVRRRLQELTAERNVLEPELRQLRMGTKTPAEVGAALRARGVELWDL
ncbi:MAG TPA: hypothetical protein VFG76_04285 [Candidatus Polarisedimenticolia bacterium]|nr:hypothetical protein [Candidatus Polarisedimenticolia bacterium]